MSLATETPHRSSRQTTRAAIGPVPFDVIPVRDGPSVQFRQDLDRDGGASLDGDICGGRAPVPVAEIAGGEQSRDSTDGSTDDPTGRDRVRQRRRVLDAVVGANGTDLVPAEVEESPEYLLVREVEEARRLARAVPIDGDAGHPGEQSLPAVVGVDHRVGRLERQGGSRVRAEPIDGTAPTSAPSRSATTIGT